MAADEEQGLVTYANPNSEPKWKRALSTVASLVRRPAQEQQPSTLHPRENDPGRTFSYQDWLKTPPELLSRSEIKALRDKGYGEEAIIGSSQPYVADSTWATQYRYAQTDRGWTQLGINGGPSAPVEMNEYEANLLETRLKALPEDVRTKTQDNIVGRYLNAREQTLIMTRLSGKNNPNLQLGYRDVEFTRNNPQIAESLVSAVIARETEVPTVGQTLSNFGLIIARGVAEALPGIRQIR